MTPLLDVRGLHKRFGGLVATAGVDLQVLPGEVHALIGPNGAGKTTLVSQLAGGVTFSRSMWSCQAATRSLAHQMLRDFSAESGLRMG